MSHNCPLSDVAALQRLNNYQGAFGAMCRPAIMKDEAESTERPVRCEDRLDEKHASDLAVSVCRAAMLRLSPQMDLRLSLDAPPQGASNALYPISAEGFWPPLKPYLPDSKS
jgi:hypothetical protein